MEVRPSLKLTVISSVPTVRVCTRSKGWRDGIQRRGKKAVLALFISTVIIFSSSFLMRLLTGSNESVIIENSSRYLLINAPFYAILAVLFNLRLTLQGIGEKIVPIISSMIELAGKVLFAFLIVPAFGYFGVIISEPVIWCVMCLQLAFSYYRNPYIRNL